MATRRVEDGLQLAVDHFLVELLGKRFEVDFDGVHAAAQLFQRLFLDVAPLITTLFTPAARPASAVSRTYSEKTTGSL